MDDSWALSLVNISQVNGDRKRHFQEGIQIRDKPHFDYYWLIGSSIPYLITIFISQNLVLRGRVLVVLVNSRYVGGWRPPSAVIYMLSTQFITILWPSRLYSSYFWIKMGTCFRTSGSWFFPLVFTVINYDESYILVKTIFFVECLSSSLNYLLLFLWIKVTYCFSSVILSANLENQINEAGVILSSSNVIRCS